MDSQGVPAQMNSDEVLEQVRAVPEAQRAGLLAAATKEMSGSGQAVVARQGIDKGAWPQESMHRMITILGCVALALGACAIAVWAGSIGAKDVAAALVAVATAIVGGIFGYAQAAK